MCCLQTKLTIQQKFRFLEISKLQVPERTAHYDPIQGTPRLVIVPVSSTQKSGSGYSNLANGKEPGKTDQIGPSSKVFPNIPIGLNRNDPLHLISFRNFRNFGLNEWKALNSP